MPAPLSDAAPAIAKASSLPPLPGLTGLEVLMGFVLLAMVALVGVPSYSSYSAHSRHAAAQAALYAVSDRQEQYYLDHQAYARNLRDLGYGSDRLLVTEEGVLIPAGAPRAEASTAIYAVTLKGRDPASYTVEAETLAGDSCGDLSLSHDGRKGYSGTGQRCW
jgi:Tfp pilus assembly protein PilE